VNDPDTRFFEDVYRHAGDDGAIPWAALAPRPALLEWLGERPDRPGASALVVACGFGDDAEELARRGYRVRAFDAAPTAIARCRSRFPGSAVDYRTADLFALPADWVGGHDLVVEIQTIQSLPLSRRAAVISAIAATVAPAGELFVRASARGDDEPVHGRPWPVSRAELAGFTASGLETVRWREHRDESGVRWFHVAYRRPPA
jgi:2-polyprenyl-3-methyl-5-hydroxy-6-metoxy-1,4-benzoquinol methylase